MTDATEAVEGQALARAVLADLDAGRKPDWEPLDRAYRGALLGAAAARLPAGIDAEDVMHEFLCQKLFPEGGAHALLSPVARGERPLRAQLLRSLANYCVD